MDEIFFDLFDAEQLNNICVLLDITIPKMKLDWTIACNYIEYILTFQPFSMMVNYIRVSI